MKEFTCRTNSEGYTVSNKESYCLPSELDEKFGRPQNAIIKCKYEILEGYREVTQEEKEKYQKQKGVKYWSNNVERFLSISNTGEWNKNVDYYIPINFKFKGKKLTRELTDEDAIKRPKVLAWDYKDQEKTEGILMGIADIGRYKYYIKRKNGTINYYESCELIEN